MEGGRAGRKGQSSDAVLYWNNRDVAEYLVGMDDDMRQYCRRFNKLKHALSGAI